MHRLSDFGENVVGYIDDIVDRSDSNRSQSGFYLLRRRENLDIFHACRHVSRAKRLVFNVNRHHVVHTSANGFIIDFGFSTRSFERDCDFFCHFVNTVAIGSVCRDGYVENHVVESERVKSVHTELRAFFKADDVAHLLSLHVVFCHTDFFESAKHTFRHNAAKFAFDDFVSVRKICAVKRNRNSFAAHNGNVGDDLYGLCADVDLRDAQTVRIRMLFDIHDFADDNGSGLFVLIYNIFDFEADCYEFFRKRFGRYFYVNVIFEP